MGSAAIPVARQGPQPAKGISALKPNEALRLDNWFPKGGYCQIRGGYTSHVTGLGASVGSLVEWAGPASRKMFGATRRPSTTF
jgi:hypothetical protein